MNAEQIIQEWERPVREEWEQGDETDTAFLYARIAGLLRAKCAHLLHEKDALQRKAAAYEKLVGVLREWADDEPDMEDRIFEALDLAYEAGYIDRKAVEVEA